MSQSKSPSELFLPFFTDDQPGTQYQRLFRAFQQAILQGDLQAGAKLPATRPLCEELGLSRNTVKTAYEMLHAEGYTETSHGSGTFVSNSLPDQKPDGNKRNNSHETRLKEPRLSRLAGRLQNLHFPTHGIGMKANLLAPAEPCVRSFPWKQWQKHVSAAGKSLKEIDQDSINGYQPLRHQIASYLQIVRGVQCDARQVMICSGSQQALYLTFQMLLDDGEDVLIEDPGYRGIIGALQTLGINPVAVPSDSSGFCPSKAFSLSPSARVVLLTPSRNYPMGYTLALDRRIKLLNQIIDINGWLIEDDYDSEFRFDGPPLTSLQGLGGEQNTLYIGTFSRILHPSVRLGYLVIPENLIDIFQQARRYMDGGLSLVPQIALAGFMASGEFSSHLRRMRRLYQSRREILHTLIEKEFKGLMQRVESDGGMHSVFLLPQGWRDDEICQSANKAGVAVRPLSRYYAGRFGMSGLVMGFAGYDEADIKAAVEILAPIVGTQKR